MYSRILEARSSGDVSIDLYAPTSNIEVVADPGCRRASVEVYTNASSGATVEMIDALSLKESGGSVSLRLPQSGGMQISSQGEVHVSGDSVTFQGAGFSSSMVSIGGDADMTVNGQRIQVRSGRTWVNGVEVTSGGGAASDPPRPVHLRATVPTGSLVVAQTYSGDISTSNVGTVRLQTYSGDLRATGLRKPSSLTTYSGDVAVGGEEGHPEVVAKTYSGDIVVLNDNIRIRPKTYSGDVRYV